MKFPRFSASLLVISATLTFASVAAAQEAYTTRQVNLRAGPDRGYPLVAWASAGTAVYVNGCINDYRWCDVTAGPNRGWVYAKFIEYPYQNRRLPIYGNGPTLALPIVSFILGSYWNDHYRDRPWYGGQNNWNNWRPGNRPPTGYRPQPQPPRPVFRPDRPRPQGVIQPRPQPQPPVVRPQRPSGNGQGQGRPQGNSPQVPEQLPGFGKPGPNSPASQR